jgi:Ca2+-binding RTX toxin-like protein
MMAATEGHDILTGTADAETLDGLGGNDSILGRGGNDLLIGGDGHDTIRAGTGAGTILGGEGDDLIFAGSGAWLIFGGGGNDTIIGADGNDTILGEEGDDLLVGNAGADSIGGGNGADSVEGRGGSDTLFGGDGNDTMLGGGAGDFIAGEDGDDFLVGAWLVAPRAPTALALSAATVTENEAGAVIGTLSATDSDPWEAFRFSVDDARFEVVDGVLRLRTGITLDHEAAATVTVRVTVRDGENLTFTQAFEIAVVDIAGATISGTSVNDTVDAATAPSGRPGPTAEADWIRGFGGNDSLAGLGGADTLDGGVGADTMAGGAGDDLYIVNSSADLVIEAAGEGVDTIRVAGSLALPEEVEVLEITGTGNFSGTGNAADNRIVGNAGNNLLAGLGGADLLDGGAGLDTASYLASAGGVAVSLASGTGTGGDAEGDTLHGIENLIGSALADTLEGDGHANRLEGRSGNDWLDGGAGADTLIGGAGADTLDGGEGEDRFVFGSASHSGNAAPDRIADFEAGLDLIDLSAIDANGAAAGNGAFLWGGQDAAVVAFSVTWFESGGTTVVQGDTNGKGGAELRIVLSGTGLGLAASDFVL